MDVYCGNCGRKLDEGRSVMPEDRTPCPDCGSVARRFDVELGAQVVMLPTIESKATVFPPIVKIGTAEEHDEALPIVATKQRGFAALIATLQAQPGDSFRVLRWTAVGEDVLLSEVLDEQGEVIHTGIGDDVDSALIDAALESLRPDGFDT